MTKLRLEPEYTEAYNSWKNDPTPESLGGVLKAFDPYLSEGIKTYPMEDQGLLKAQAKRIFIGALPRYNPEQTSLRTYMSGQLRGLSRFARNQSNLLNIPERIIMERRKLDDAEHEFRDKYGRLPSTAELSRATKLSGRRIQNLRKSVLPQNSGYFMRLGEEGTELNTPVVETTPVLRMQLEHIYDSLNPEEQVILEHDYSLFGKKKLSVTELAKRIGKSPATVSQIRNRINQKIDRTEGILFG